MTEDESSVFESVARVESEQYDTLKYRIAAVGVASLVMAVTVAWNFASSAKNTLLDYPSKRFVPEPTAPISPDGVYPRQNDN